MSTDSPISILFNSDGYELNVKSDTLIPSGTSGVLVAGTDGVNSRFISVDSLGRQIIVGSGNFTVAQSTASNLNANVSGTVTSNIGTTNGLALDATLTSGISKFQIYDGTNVLGTSAHPVKIDPIGTTTQPISGTVTANAGTGTFTVSGAVNQSGSWTVQPGNTANTTPWLTTINQGGNSVSVTVANALKVDNSGVTQPVSGTVTANAGSGTFTVSGTVASTQSGSWSQNISQFGGTNVVTGVGASGSGIPRVTVSNDSNILATQSGSWTVTANQGTSPWVSSITDSATRLLGVIYGSQGQQLKQTATNFNSQVELAVGATLIDPRSIRALTSSDVVTANAGSGTFAISGAVTQSGSWTVQPGNTANTTPWLTSLSQGGNTATISVGGALKVDNSAVTQPVSGTITANAGSGNFTVIGASSDNSANSTSKIPVIVARANTVAPTFTDGNMVPLSVDTSGNLRISGTISATNPSVSTTAAAPPSSATYIGASVTTAAPTYTTGQINALSLTTSGLLRVDNSGVTQPVSGTITANAGSGTFTVSGTVAATQSGTWTIQPGNTANTTPWLTTLSQGGNSATVSAAGALKVDNSAVTQPISGTVTANIGTSGSLALESTQVKLTIAQSTALGTNTQAMVGGSVTTAAPTYTTGNINPLSLTTAGALRTDSSSTTQPVSAASLPLPTGASTETTLGTRLADSTFTTRINTLGQKTMANSTPVVLASDQSVIPSSQSGIWTIQPGNTANSTPWLTTLNQGGNSATISAAGALKVDNSAVTQPVSGTITANIGTSGSLALDVTVAKLTIAQSTALGTNTQALVGGSVTTSAPTYTTGNINPLSLTTVGALRVDASATTQPVSGAVTANAGTGSFTVAQATAANLNATIVGTTAAGSGASAGLVTVQGNASGTPIPVTGTITASSASTGIDGSAALASDTQVGGKVTTAAPTYTTGNLNALSLTTGGLLRIDGVYPVNATTPTSDATFIAGAVTTAAPTYTTGQMSALSLTTAGALRIDGSATTQPVSGTVTANIGTSGSLALDATVAKLTIAQSTALGTNTQAMVGGSVTTAAPTYTTGNINPLSLTTAGALRVDASATTQPVSGTVTSNIGTTNGLALNATLTGGTQTSRITDGTNTATVKAASTAALATDTSLVVSLNPNNSALTGFTNSSYLPDSIVVTSTNQQVAIDPSSRLETHSAITTDEGSFRDDFSGTSLTTAITGTLTFTNNSTTLTGSGSAFTTQLQIGQWIKKTSDAETLYVRVDSITSDTLLTFTTAYQGTTAATTGVFSNWSTITATGGTITVASSGIALTSGTTSGQSSYIYKIGDYLPYTFQVYLSVSQSIVNQVISAGFRDVWTGATKRAEVQFTGVTNTQVNFVTASSSAAADIQTTTVTIPNGGVSSGFHLYKIDVSGTQCTLTIDGVIVAINSNHIPGPYDNLSIFAGTNNTGVAASSTTLTIDYIYFYNTDRVQIDQDFTGEPLPTQGSNSNGQLITVNPILLGGSDGSYIRNIKTDKYGNLSTFLGDTGNLSAFGRLRVAQPLALFSNKQINDNQPLYWDDQQTAGGSTTSTYLANKAATQILVANNVAGTRVRQSFRRMNYQSGKGMLILCTAVLINEGGVGVAAVNRRVGYFDGNNGYFFELIGTVINIAIRTNTSGSPVTTYVPQSSWNLDKLDGTGTSGYNLNLAQAHIFFIDFQWLGVGRIRYGFDLNGSVIYCHQIVIANNQALVSVSNPNLPIRYEIQSLGTGTATTASMQHICASVISEGGQEDVGFTFGVDTGATVLATGNNTNIYTLLAMQLKAGYLNAEIQPLSFTVACSTATSQFRVALILNPTIAGAAITYTGVTNSAVQFGLGVAANLITAGTGTTIYSGYFQSNRTGAGGDKLSLDISLGSTIAGVSDTLVLAIQPVPALSSSFSGSFNWKEAI